MYNRGLYEGGPHRLSQRGGVKLNAKIGGRGKNNKQGTEINQDHAFSGRLPVNGKFNCVIENGDGSPCAKGKRGVDVAWRRKAEAWRTNAGPEILRYLPEIVRCQPENIRQFTEANRQ